MHFEDSEVAPFTKWLVKRLENLTDADADVLAEYVLALVRSEEPDEQVKANCLQNLADFLHANTEPFVKDLFETHKTKAYLPESQRPGRPAVNAALPNPLSAGTPAAAQTTSRNGPGDNTRKRGRDEDTDMTDMPERRFKERRGDRPYAEGRGRGRGGRGRGTDNMYPSRMQMPGQHGFSGGRGQQQHGQQQQFINGFPNMPTPPAGFPPIDPNNPLAAMMAMQAMGFQFPQMPGMPQIPGSMTGGQGNGDMGQGRGHSRNGGAPEEYDPQNSSLNGGRGRGSRGGRGGRGDGTKAQRSRAPFSSAAPTSDRTNTKLVIEQIPEENFSEEAVREFFEPFGTIASVDMQPYKRLAVLEFADHDSAQRAWDSPKVIFDNRFVKCFWYKSAQALKKPGNHHNPKTPAGARSRDVEMTDELTKQNEEPVIDPVEFQKRQEEAQRSHEEKTRKLQEASAAREELDRKIREQADERKKLLEKLASKASSTTSATASAGPAANNVGASLTSDGGTTTEVANGDKKSQTDALKAKLAALEAEAESIGLNPNDADTANGFPPRGRGRGATFRGRGRGRGSYFSSRGYYGGAGRGAPGGVKRLDNRPKKISVVGIAEGGEGDEALRQFIFNNYEVDAIEKHPERQDAQIVAFKERYIAEKFIAEAKQHPPLSAVELSWVAAPLPPPPSTMAAAATPTSSAVAITNVAGDAAMGNDQAVAPGPSAGAVTDQYDVAEDDDKWMDTA